MSKADLERLWEWSENIREEVGALSDAIAKLAAEDLPDGGDDEETPPLGFGAKTISEVR